MTTTTVLHLVAAALGLLPLAGTAAPPEIGWSLEFEEPAELEVGRLACIGKLGAAAPSPEIADIRIEDGVLHLGAKFDDQSVAGHYVTISWGVGWSNQPADDPFVPDPQPAAIAGASIQDYPMLEVRWRRPHGLNQPIQGNCIWLLERADGSRATGYSTVMSRSNTGWTTTLCPFAPDSLFPGPYTPVKVLGVRLELGAADAKAPAAIELDYIRVRELTEDEYAVQIERAAPLRGYEPAPLPARLRYTFVFGVCHAAAYAGGWEGYFDELARAHINAHFGMGSWHADMTHVARAAAPRGIMLFPYSSATPTQYEGTWATAGPEQAWDTAAEQARAARELPAIAGWFLADEPSVQKLLGVAGIKRIYDKLTPELLGAYVHFSLDRIKYFDRFTTVVMSDHYPIREHKRDPWDVAEWCRRIDEFSTQPHWYWPQVFADFPWHRSMPRYHNYAGPTPAELRLMLYLALANGTKGFVLFDYAHEQWIGLADQVGNLSPLGREAAAIGERWLTVCPLLLEAETLYEPKITTVAGADPDHGVSVSAMGDPELGPLFLVAVNESLEQEQGARAQLPASFVAADRAVFDLYRLEPAAAAGSSGFDVVPLPPGAGRIYLLGTAAQFAVARIRVLTNRVNERLRIQGADRELAHNWNVDFVPEYDRAAAQVRERLADLAVDRSETDAAAAGAALAAAMAGAAALDATRQSLAAVKAALGDLNLCIHAGAQQPRDGFEDAVTPYQEFCRRYNRVRNDFMTGRCGPWTDFRVGAREIQAAAALLAEDVQAFAAGL